MSRNKIPRSPLSNRPLPRTKPTSAKAWGDQAYQVEMAGISARIPATMLERLRDISAVTDISLSDMVRRGLQDQIVDIETRYRQRTGQELPSRPKPPKKVKLD